MGTPSTIEPIVGGWYASHGELFEVVAMDDDAGSIEIQHADGSLAEIDGDDWGLRQKAGQLRAAEPPEGLSASDDLDSDVDESYRDPRARYDDDVSLRASGLDDLDLFD